MGSATTKPAIHPADRCRARRQRVCPGRDRRRISVRLAVDDRGERRNIRVRARPARAQSPRCTPRRCYRIIDATIAISCAIRTRQVSDGPAALLVSRALRLVRGLRCESGRPSCESDGSTSDVLMKLIGGPGKVMLFLEGIHVPDIQVVNYEKEIGRDWETQYRNWATPKAR